MTNMKKYIQAFAGLYQGRLSTISLRTFIHICLALAFTSCKNKLDEPATTNTKNMRQNLHTASIMSFSHPGLLNNTTELDFIKAKVNSNTEPWLSAYNQMKGQNNYLTRTPQAMDTLVADYGHPAHTTTDRDLLLKDGEIVYGCALIYYITGDVQYAQKAVQIMNSWATVNKAFTGGDAPLVAGYAPPQMIWGAEILRYSYSGWAPADISNFENWLSGVIYPLVKDGSGNAPNWQSWMACCALNIGVFNNDSVIWDDGISLYNAILPTTITATGKGGEICRDLWHTQMGIAALTYGAEVAEKQNVDLYSGIGNDNRLLLGAEYTAFLMMTDVSKDPESGCTLNERETGFYPFYQFIYNHYRLKNGIPTPKSKYLIDYATGNYSNGIEKFARGGWGTLTHNNVTGQIVKTPVSASWTLLTDPSPTVSGTTITASSQSVGPYVVGIDYGVGYNTVTYPGNNNLQRVPRNGITVGYDSTMYVEYQVAPVAGKYLRIEDIRMDAIGGGDATVRLVAKYSIDNFATSHDLQSTYKTLMYPTTVSNPVPLTKGTSTSVEFTDATVGLKFPAAMININPGQTFKIRLYVFNTITSVGKRYLASRNVKISGVTSDTQIP